MGTAVKEEMTTTARFFHTLRAGRTHMDRRGRAMAIVRKK
jgi:hypothetical protein